MGQSANLSTSGGESETFGKQWFAGIRVTWSVQSSRCSTRTTHGLLIIFFSISKFMVSLEDQLLPKFVLFDLLK